MEWIVIVVFALLCLAWESQSAGTRKRQKEAYIFDKANAHGAAAFAGNKDLTKGRLFRGKGVPIGYSPDGRHALHYPGFGHLSDGSGGTHRQGRDPAGQRAAVVVLLLHRDRPESRERRYHGPFAQAFWKGFRPQPVRDLRGRC